MLGRESSGWFGLLSVMCRLEVEALRIAARDEVEDDVDVEACTMMLRVTGSRLNWTPAQARGPPRLPSVGPSDVRTTPARDQHFLGCVR